MRSYTAANRRSSNPRTFAERSHGAQVVRQGAASRPDEDLAENQIALVD
jgi:hypothetical protein